MTIMVPIDGSYFSEQALPMALQIAAQTRASVHIIRVHRSPFTASLASVTEQFDEALDGETRDLELKYLKVVSERSASDTGISVQAFSVDGLVVDALAAHVLEHDIDLVVMTTHGRGGLSRAWLGSVADRLIRTLDIPVLLRRPLGHSASGSATGFDSSSQPGPQRVLIPLDGSALAETIIAEALVLGEFTGAAFILMQVVPPPITASPEATLQFEMDTTAARYEAAAYLAVQAAALGLRGHDVEIRVVMQSNVAAAIVEESVASRCDMIAMATHGRSGFVRMALGSVADKVLRSAAVPLLVMKPEDVCEAATVLRPAV